MDLYVADENYNVLSILDTFTSVIWTRRYNECGDFEVCVPASAEMFELLVPDNYIYRLDDDTVMIIEKVQLQNDTENGDYIVCTGRSAESLIARRIVWGQKGFYGYAEEFIREVMNENVVSPAIYSRKIPEIVLGDDNGFKDPIGVQYTCENMLTVVYETCQKYDMGFRLVKRGGVLREKLYFELYKGTDHSESQHVNPIVVFSPDFDNLINSEYCMDMTEYANTAYIAGEGEGNQRKKAILGGSQGKKRREIFVDAGSVSSKSDIVMTDDNYMMALYDKGQEQLSEKRGKFTFSVTIENLNMYKYKQDYDVGDIVTIKNEYGIIADVRITEVTESEDSTGFSVIPTFEQEVSE